jgi:hypothetical protein
MKNKPFLFPCLIILLGHIIRWTLCNHHEPSCGVRSERAETFSLFPLTPSLLCGSDCTRQDEISGSCMPTDLKLLGIWVHNLGLSGVWLEAWRANAGSRDRTPIFLVVVEWGVYTVPQATHYFWELEYPFFQTIF